MAEKPDPRLAIVFGVIAGFLIAVGNLYWQLERTRAEVSNLRQSIVSEVGKLSEATQQAAGRRTNAAAAAEPSRKILETLKQELAEELTSAKRQASSAAQIAKTEAVTHANKLAARIGEEGLSQHKEVIGELGQIKQTETVTAKKIDDVSTDLANIKEEVASTRQELEQTVSELKRVNGDLGVQSGYIATNARELQALKVLGERNYYEFHIDRSGKAHRVGDVSISLKKTDVKRNKYTVEILAGDKKTEKKEKVINEPVQFYVSKARQPFEIVVNEVQKDYIIGYLATPKELVVARND